MAKYNVGEEMFDKFLDTLRTVADALNADFEYHRSVTIETDDQHLSQVIEALLGLDHQPIELAERVKVRCPHCQLYFTNLDRHIRKQHPEPEIAPA